MSIRGSITLECDQKGCHAELVVDVTVEHVVSDEPRLGIDLEIGAAGWHIDDDERLW